MTALLLLAIAALAALLVRQHRKTRAAAREVVSLRGHLHHYENKARTAEADRDEHRANAAAARVELAATRAAARKSAAMSLSHAVAAEHAEATCLPRAPFRTASPDIAAVPYAGPDIELTLPPLLLGDHTCAGKVTPIKRAAVKKAGVKR